MCLVFIECFYSSEANDGKSKRICHDLKQIKDPWKIDKIVCNSMFLRKQIVCQANCSTTLKQIHHVIEI